MNARKKSIQSVIIDSCGNSVIDPYERGYWGRFCGLPRERFVAGEEVEGWDTCDAELAQKKEGGE